MPDFICFKLFFFCSFLAISCRSLSPLTIGWSASLRFQSESNWNCFTVLSVINLCYGRLLAIVVLIKKLCKEDIVADSGVKFHLLWVVFNRNFFQKSSVMVDLEKLSDLRDYISEVDLKKCLKVTIEYTQQLSFSNSIFNDCRESWHQVVFVFKIYFMIWYIMKVMHLT